MFVNIECNNYKIVSNNLKLYKNDELVSTLSLDEILKLNYKDYGAFSETIIDFGIKDFSNSYITLGAVYFNNSLECHNSLAKDIIKNKLEETDVSINLENLDFTKIRR